MSKGRREPVEAVEKFLPNYFFPKESLCQLSNAGPSIGDGLEMSLIKPVLQW